jgi:replicative DNA helicase
MTDIPIPPHSAASEQALIGAALVDSQVYERVADLVRAEDFYQASHRVLWSTMTAMAESDQALDIFTVAERLERDGHLEDAGGLVYLGTLARGSVSSANSRAYAGHIREAAIKRALIAAGSEQIDAAHNPEGREAKDLLAEAQERLAQLAERGMLGNGWTTSQQATHRAIERIERLYAAGGGMVGVSTGWADLDAMTRGLEPGSLVIIAARPSMGKTTAAVQIAQHIATSHDKPAALFSLEMSAESLALRLLSASGRIDHDHLRSAQLEEDELQRLTPASTKTAELNLHIDDQAGLSVADLIVRAKRLHRQHGGLSVIAIDYLGLLAVPAKIETHALAIGRITAALKGLAKALHVPVILLSQLNRDVEKRPNKRPIMSDLRDSGSIEQDADLILFLYRDEVYHPESKDKGVAEIIIGKQRNGPTGTVKLAWQGKYCRFDNLAPEWEQAMASTSKTARSYEY